MNTMMRILLLTAITLSTWFAATTVHAADSGSLVSDRGHYRVTWESRVSPIEINRIHAWVLHVEDAAGVPVSDAVLGITGGMPAHNHGLATDPGIEAIGNGDYAVRGLRFHMMGHWELELTIDRDGLIDRVLIPLDL